MRSAFLGFDTDFLAILLFFGDFCSVKFNSICPVTCAVFAIFMYLTFLSIPFPELFETH